MKLTKKSVFLEVKLEILEQSYWEHYKFAKDLAQYFPITHPKRVFLEKELSLMINQINDLKK